MAQYFQTFSKNLLGRDYAVGDIHGRFHELMQSLQDIEFDFSCDRLFSVGDLVDRGTESREVVELINQNWFYAVRGNHDQMIIDQFDDERVLLFNYQDQSPQEVHFNLDGKWFAKLGKQKQKWFYESLKNLPYLIEVETDNGRVGICHAGLPRSISDWQLLKSQVSERDIREQILRTRGAPKQERVITGIDITVHGHTCFDNLYQNNNSFWIDTFDKAGKHLITEFARLLDY